MTNAWKPSSEGPPPRSKYSEMHEWLVAHPGEWVVITDSNVDSAYSTLRRHANRYEIVKRNNVIYVRYNVKEPAE